MNKPRPARIVGIDFGMCRIGLALSDANKIIAIPHSIVAAEKKSELTIKKMMEAFANICEMHGCEIEEIVVGLPLLLSGKTGLLADEVKHFTTLLAQSTSIPIKMWDERLTTVQAERSLREGGMTRKKRAKVVDKISAAILLQSYLDSKGLIF
ncbi:MAG: Holliday junction resolvase RuvX [Parachlamydia sp.]|jgi:putative Holliday junction resolvase|nr:Holliday junction resolvase RuvX [Parachlamydia sp.]